MQLPWPVHRQSIILSRSSCLSQVQCVGRVWQLPWPVHIVRVSFCGHPVCLRCLGRVWQLPWPVHRQLEYHSVVILSVFSVWVVCGSSLGQSTDCPLYGPKAARVSVVILSVFSAWVMCVTRHSWPSAIEVHVFRDLSYFSHSVSTHAQLEPPGQPTHVWTSRPSKHASVNLRTVSPLRCCRGRRTTLTSATMLAVCRGEHH